MSAPSVLAESINPAPVKPSWRLSTTPLNEQSPAEFSCNVRPVTPELLELEDDELLDDEELEEELLEELLELEEELLEDELLDDPPWPPPHPVRSNPARKSNPTKSAL